MQKITLDQAHEQIAEQATQIQGLQARITEFESNDFFKRLEISRTEENGVVTFSSAILTKLNADFQALEAEHAVLSEAFTKADQALNTANTKIAELEKQDKNVSNRAREFLASMGGQPLSLGTQSAPELTGEDLRKQMNSEKDPALRAALYKKLKAIEKK